MGSQVSVDAGALHVVIVGGGFGGIAAASQLQALNIPFMLVDTKDSFHHNVAALRASVESGKVLLSGVASVRLILSQLRLWFQSWGDFLHLKQVAQILLSENLKAATI
jgi:monoamine oxidase